MKTIFNYSLMVLLTIWTLTGIYACSDDDTAGTPVIKSVCITDPEAADSTFVQAFPGQLIVITGENLGGATKVYVNDQSLNFNPNMNTNTSIIVRIPAEVEDFELTSQNPDLKAEIRVVTPGGVASYTFKVLSPVPEIARIAAIYPRETGSEIKVHGINFLDIERVYFTDINPYPEVGKGETPVVPAKGNEVDVTNYDLELERYLDELKNKYITTSLMTLTLPDISYNDGFLVIECTQGNSVIDFAKLPPPPVINQISSNMPIVGERVYLKGLYFVGLEEIRIGDEITVPAGDFTVAETEDALSFIMPAKPSTMTDLTLVTAGGEYTIGNFYPYESVLVDYDGLGMDQNWSPNWEYKTADGTAEPYISDGRFAILTGDYPQNWWGPMNYHASNDWGAGFPMPGYDLIPADTPIEDLYLVFECYNKNVFEHAYIMWVWEDVNGGYYQVQDYNWGTMTPATPVFLGAFGEPVYGEWFAAELRMSLFGEFAGLTYKDIVEKKLNRVRLQFMNPSTETEHVFLGVDNIRLMKK